MEEKQNSTDQESNSGTVASYTAAPHYPYFGKINFGELTIKLRWWQKIILWFKPAYVGVDFGSVDKAYYTIIKKLGDKTIVLKTGEAKIEIGIDEAV